MKSPGRRLERSVLCRVRRRGNYRSGKPSGAGEKRDDRHHRPTPLVALACSGSLPRRRCFSTRPEARQLRYRSRRSLSRCSLCGTIPARRAHASIRCGVPSRDRPSSRARCGRCSPASPPTKAGPATAAGSRRRPPHAAQRHDQTPRRIPRLRRLLAAHPQRVVIVRQPAAGGAARPDRDAVPDRRPRRLLIQRLPPRRSSTDEGAGGEPRRSDVAARGPTPSRLGRSRVSWRLTRRRA